MTPAAKGLLVKFTPLFDKPNVLQIDTATFQPRYYCAFYTINIIMFKQWLAKKQNWGHLSSKHDYRGPKIYSEKETTSQLKVPYEQTQE